MKLPVVSLLAAATLAYTTLSPHASYADDSKPLSKQEVEALVKQVIKDNPEFILRTLEEYQESQQLQRISKAAQNLVKKQDQIQRDPRSPSIGDPNGDVTVVEFFDYHCGYCKRFFPELGKLLHDDKHVRVVFKEFPILSEDSSAASKAALAVFNIDKAKYFDYHILLMQSNSEFTEEVLTDKAREVGIDPDKFKAAYGDPELEKDLERNKQLAKELAITGTPAIIIGTQFMPGAIDYDTLKGKIQEARDSQNQQKNAGKPDK